MKLACIHCGKSFVIRAEQLGTKGRCPHCRGEISLPKASDDADLSSRGIDPRGWIDRWVSSLTSMILHMLVILLIAFYDGEGTNTAGPGEEVQIGTLPVELTESPIESLDAEPASPTDSPSAGGLDEMLEVEPPVLSAASESAIDATLPTPSVSGGGDPARFDLGGVGIGAAGGMAGGGSWDGMIRSLRRHGLDVVIAFDSTGSMSGEIDAVKGQIRKIGSTLTTLVPKVRLSICTYRDEGDEFVVKGLPLTGDLKAIEYYLSGISAGGGGDHPEAVDMGLAWAVSKNKFRPTARKVILLFGDAPPHSDKQAVCLKLAREFREQEHGVVSTVTCRDRSPMPEFYAIADAGGGEAFLTTDTRQIVSQLIVLVFGSQHKAKVLEAFKLLEK